MERLNKPIEELINHKIKCLDILVEIEKIKMAAMALELSKSSDGMSYKIEQIEKIQKTIISLRIMKHAETKMIRGEK